MPRPRDRTAESPNQVGFDLGHSNKPLWAPQFCRPEGFLRRWHESALWAQYWEGGMEPSEEDDIFSFE